MISFHPSPTSGDGEPIVQSRYIKRSDRLDNMVQCAQCGWYVDLDKRPIGDSLGAITSATPKTQTFTPPRGKSFTDQFADPIDTNSGCPFCNSMNPKGFLRNKIVGSGVNVSNLP